MWSVAIGLCACVILCWLCFLAPIYAWITMTILICFFMFWDSPISWPFLLGVCIWKFFLSHPSMLLFLFCLKWFWYFLWVHIGVVCLMYTSHNLSPLYSFLCFIYAVYLTYLIYKAFLRCKHINLLFAESCSLPYIFFVILCCHHESQPADWCCWIKWIFMWLPLYV